MAATIAVILGCTVVATGCASSTEAPAASDDGTDFLDRAGAEAEYARALSAYDLPPGRPVPTDKLPGGAPDGQFQAGYGEMAATSVWNCAWAAEYMDRTTTPGADAGAALDRFDAILTVPAYSEYFDAKSFTEMYEDVVASSRLGDDSKMRKFLDIDCPGYLGAES